MIAVIDANIAVALLVDIAYSQAAHAAVKSAESLIAPDIIIPEVSNAFWKMARVEPGLIAHLQKAMAFLPKLLDEKLDAAWFANAALNLALQHNHPTYDCYYLLAAQTAKATLLTADRKLFALAQQTQTSAQLITP